MQGVDSRKLTHRNFKLLSNYVLSMYSNTSVTKMGATIALNAIRQHVDGDT